MIDCLRSFWLVKGRHPPGCPTSNLNDVAVRGCQLRTVLTTDCIGGTRLIWHVPSSSRFGKRLYPQYSDYYVSKISGPQEQMCLLLIKLCFYGLFVSCMGAALVEVFSEIEGQTAFSHDHQSWLEVWTDDGSLPVSAHHCQQPVATGGQILGQMSLAVQEYSPVKSGRDGHGWDLIIGKPRMLKLGLGIDAKTGHLCNVKRKMRK